METRVITEINYNDRLIELKSPLTLFSDGSYLRDKGKRRYGNSNGNYLKMSLYDINGKEHKVFMHTLILCVFGNPRPSKDYEVDHVDRNKHNNDISNLRWVTRKLNIQNKNDRKDYQGRHFIDLFYAHANPLKLSYDVVHHRVFNHGWTFEEAMNTPLIGRNVMTERRARYRLKQ